MVKFCPTCKKVYPITTTVCPGCHGTNLMRFCQNCKKMVPSGATACPVCGDRDTAEAHTNTQERVKTKKEKKRAFPVFIVLFLLIGSGIATWWFLFSRVNKVTLNHASLNLVEGETATLESKIYPKWSFARETEWSSSSSKIATVDSNGNVTGVKKGTCTIFFTADGHSCGCKITVKKDGTDLAEIYKTIKGDGFYCTLAQDESYIEIDTNPNDEEYYLKDDEGAEYVVKANKALGLPDAVTIKMSQTRALDGRQMETYEDITISWTYHPDHGLDVLYEVR